MHTCSNSQNTNNSGSKSVGEKKKKNFVNCEVLFKMPAVILSYMWNTVMPACTILKMIRKRSGLLLESNVRAWLPHSVS